MAKTSSFLVISTQQKFATCTGTREQLISSGLCQPHEFPHGRARKYYAHHHTVSKVKGGNFKWESCHELDRKEDDWPVKRVEIDKTPDSRFKWRIVLPDNVSKDIVDEQMSGEMRDCARRFFYIAREARDRAMRRRVTLVAPSVTFAQK
jgi:hypothetical protein